MKKIAVLFSMATLGLTAATTAQAEVDPDRLAEFVEVIEANDCEFAASMAGTKPLFDAGFFGPEITELRRALVADGRGTFADGVFTLHSENCG